MKVDIIIRNGRVIDPFAGTDVIKDVAICNGIIAEEDASMDAKQIVDARGCIVTPGLIDFHVHSYIYGSEFAVFPEAQCFPTGVTTIVDAGSSGVANYEAYRMTTQWSRVRQYAYLNIATAGLPTIYQHENVNPSSIETDHILSMLKKYPQDILGLKLRTSKNVVGEFGIAPLKAMIDIAEKANVPFVCHVTDAPIPSNELVGFFRSGDVYAHVYHGKGYTILDETGHVMSEFFEARKRGVIFDAANGKSHFSVRVAKAAIADGFYPDIISTDQTVNNAWIPGVAFSLPYTMSRYLALGMDIPAIVKCVTANPACRLQQERELGSLTTGTCADVAIHSLVKKETVFSDPFGGTITGDTLFKTQMTIRSGSIVYRQVDF